MVDIITELLDNVWATPSDGVSPTKIIKANPTTDEETQAIDEEPPAINEKKPKKVDWWRIENVPLGWSIGDLGEHLRAVNGLGELKDDWLTLFPAYTGGTQTGLLNSKYQLDYFQDRTSTDTHYIPISESNSNLSIDCHFHGLTPLNNPTGDNIIDVIAITGLGGHAFGSWRNRESRKMWLKDFLPKNIRENIRVLTYGYNSSLTSPGKLTMLEFRREFLQDLSLTREEPAKNPRPIIFMGHSLGCLVIGQALIHCSLNDTYKDILSSTRGIFFFGAPHAGLKVDALEKMVEESSPPHKPYKLDLLRQLKEDSTYLEDHKENLIKLLDSLKLFSFYETLESQTVAEGPEGIWDRSGELEQTVKAISSLLYRKNEVRVSVHADHSNMVKFPIETNKTYRTVVKHVKEILDEHKLSHQHNDLSGESNRE